MNPIQAPKAGQQILTLTGLRFVANLGILEHEKTRPQPIQVDAELNQGVQPLLPHDDDIDHVLDYRKVRQIIIDECTAEHVNLLETLIGKLAHMRSMTAKAQGFVFPGRGGQVGIERRPEGRRMYRTRKRRRLPLFEHPLVTSFTLTRAGKGLFDRGLGLGILSQSLLHAVAGDGHRQQHQADHDSLQ